MTRRNTFRIALAVFALAFVLVLLVVDSAKGHTGTCTHSFYDWYVAMPNGYVLHRETYQGGQGSGPHYHNYTTRRLATNPYRWVLIHWHYSRSCPSHPV